MTYQSPLAPEVATAHDRLVIRQPDDWHVHLRDGAMLRGVVAYTARQFGRAIVMPNLTPPVTTTALAVEYRKRILRAAGAKSGFTPLMTCYLTDHTDPDDLRRGKAAGIVTAVKLYPAHATTNSAHGVGDIAALDRVFAVMAEIGLPLLVHGEVTDPAVDIFDREAVFIDTALLPLTRRHPALKVVLEHITTKQAVEFVRGAGPNVAATITPHHLEINRNAMFAGGIRPHFYCLPVAKREPHRLALRKAATSGDASFFLGTDSAPHRREAKEAACGCAGIFCAPAALESYVKVFDEENALDRFEAFASLNGPAFYGLPPNDKRVGLVRSPTELPDALRVGRHQLVPFHGGSSLGWRFEGVLTE
jgi:dihydroorotase